MKSALVATMVGVASAGVMTPKSAVHSSVLKMSDTTASWDHAQASNHATPDGYLIASSFTDKACSDGDNMKYGMGTGVCFTGFVNGTAVSSVSYDFVAAGKGKFTMNSYNFESIDCSGSATSVPMEFPTSCIGTDEDGSAMYTYTTSTSPWENWDSGLSFQYYDTMGACTDAPVGGSFVWLRLGACFPDDSSNGGNVFKSCGDGLYTMYNYKDGECTDFNTGVTAKMDVCAPNEPDESSDVQTNNLRTMMCS